jgi:DNA ligase-1
MITIYKKDSKGKIRFLTVSTNGGDLIQESGLLNTLSPLRASKTCKMKNIGKANETSSAVQAIKEAAALITDKLRKGYFETIVAANISGGKDFESPMLAQSYDDYKDEIQFPCYVQPKLDGCRSLSSAEKPFMSRTNKPFGTLGHINMPVYCADTFDGEVYAHGLSFQENMKIIKKYVKGETEKVKYHVYDMVLDMTFIARYHILKSLVDSMNNPSIELVPTFEVHNIEDIKKYHKIFLEQGYEGTIIRWGDEGYNVNKRSKYLIKYKDFKDEGFKIIDVLPNDADPTQGTVQCCLNEEKWYTLDGNGDVKDISYFEFPGSIFGFAPFKTNMKFSHAERREILKNKLNFIGKTAEIRFFEYSDAGIPRFPVYHGYRIDK